MAAQLPIHRRDAASLESVGGDAALRALSALQRASLSLVAAYERAHPGWVERLLTSDETPRSVEAWDEALRRQLVGLPTPAPPAAFVLAAEAHNPALHDARAALLPVGLDDALAALLSRSHQTPSLDGVTLGAALLEPARRHPHDLWGQVGVLLTRWRRHLPEDVVVDALRAQDERREQTLGRGGFGPGPAGPPGPPPGPPPGASGEGLVADDPVERFSQDRAWMRRLVMIAKHTFVWLDQLSRRFGRDISTLDAIPDEALAELQRAGVTGLWLIGAWERSPASREIKRRMGNPEALASAYSVRDTVVAGDLGGDAAMQRLQDQAARFGVRVGVDLVPNHTALDSAWVAEHPEWFLQLPEPPFPGYRFTGPDLAQDDRISVRLEDGYWDRSDAAVVYQLVHHDRGETRYVYHGNDGTVMPWNDTAQLDFTRPDTREAVLDTLVAVAKRFPILRLDAAMVLARKHVQRLWFPPPGQGGAIPSRSLHGLSEAEFTAAMPREFWVEAVERISEEAPDTLLLAEAFWMMEETFVRTLGMHRVYHSAFMHMLRDGDNAGFRRILRGMLAWSPEVLERYAHFLSNPDEETAAEQFGTMDRYFTAATLQATLPGLPMLGHGQLEGSREKYGMEAARARTDEPLDQGLLDHHRDTIFPLLRDRQRFASADRFHLFDLVSDGGTVHEDVYAFSNVDELGQPVLVVVNHGPHRVQGRLHQSAPRNEGPTDQPRLVSRTLAEALGLTRGAGPTVRFAPVWGDGALTLPLPQLFDQGLGLTLEPWARRVFAEIDVIAHALPPARPPVSQAPEPAHEPPHALPRREADPSRAVPGGLAPATPPRGAGLLLHPTSLPGPEGIGTLGQGARDVAAWAGRAGLRYWQVLPLCEGGPGESPYSSPASLVGNPWLIDLRDLAADDLLSEGEAASADLPGGPVDFARVKATKGPLLHRAARRLVEQANHPLQTPFSTWRRQHPWASDVALFGALRDEHGGQPWWTWTEALRDRRKGAMAEARARHRRTVEERVALAFLFDHQWARLRAEAERHGVLFIGDLPIYVSRDSAEAWLDRHLFEFGPAGLPERVAGVPPDAFSDTGQLWGNPLYDWAAMAEQDFGWWVRRIARCLSWTPVLRIDHFRAFSAYWAVPAEAETAMSGQWVPGPGLGLFGALRDALGPQWLLAEDLGDIDDAVHELRKRSGLLCTRVLQFGFADDASNLHLPANVPADAVVYTGTHDNDTTAGWWGTASAHEKQHLVAALGLTKGARVVPAVVDAALATPAQLAIVPAQDLLGLGTEARMNVPGVGEGNWAWRLDEGALTEALAEDLAQRVARAGRR